MNESKEIREITERLTAMRNLLNEDDVLALLDALEQNLKEQQAVLELRQLKESLRRKG